MHFTWDVKYLCAENDRTQVKETEAEAGILCSWIKRVHTVQMPMLPGTKYKLNFSVKTPAALFVELARVSLNFL